ncbi:hypothetical protein [Polyangium aurulentum]|uniref:hypothetical protein n=1 Tax=Polyangium aurulentum TaxID=2567896 RepID=UPI001F157A30|nr:hypothetical protein [Polyangium aurulentum]
MRETTTTALGSPGRPFLRPLVPADPSPTLTAPRPPSIEAAGSDPELLALPAPPKRERTATVLLMAVTAIAATWLAILLFGEARYALTPGQPHEIGDLATLKPTADLANRYVRADGLLGTAGAIKYGRAAEGDSFRLAPIAGNPSIWIEIRVPEGFEGPRFVPPTSFAGRLVPFEKAGIRHARLPDAVRAQTDAQVPEDAWVLIDGGSPRASRWAVALVLLFLGFAGWNVAGIVRVLGRVRDREGAPEPG